MTKKSLLVVGDSFCFWRDQAHDWPLALASLLNLRLLGFGVPGASWWFIREKLLEIVASAEWTNIELVVFCHTEPNRIIGTQETIQHRHENKKIVRTYLEHLQNLDFNDWACEQWFKELNDILRPHKTMHLQNFYQTQRYFHHLQGIRLGTPALVDLSRNRADFNVLVSDQRRNHFTAAQNLRLANFLAHVYRHNAKQWPDQDFEISI